MLVLVDMDDVLCDTEAGFRMKLLETFPEIPAIPFHLRTTFDFEDQYPRSVTEAITSCEGYFRDLPEMTGAVLALREMLAAGHDVRICTSPLLTSRSCASEKYEWVSRCLGTEWGERLIITRDKTFVRGQILIDDNPQPRGACAPTWEHVIFTRPWNQQVADKRRLDTWREWREVLKDAATSNE